MRRILGGCLNTADRPGGTYGWSSGVGGTSHLVQIEEKKSLVFQIKNV